MRRASACDRFMKRPCLFGWIAVMDDNPSEATQNLYLGLASANCACILASTTMEAGTSSTFAFN